MTPAAELLRAELLAVWSAPPRPPDPAMEPITISITIPRCILTAIEREAAILDTTARELAGVKLSSAVLSAEQR